MLRMRLNGLDRVLRKVDPNMIPGPLRTFFARSAIVLQGRARERAPKDRGQLANSIAYEVDPASPPLWAKVGTNLGVKARAMEFGTGIWSDAPDSKHAEHFPPWGERNPELELWARRHGLPNAFVVARAIARRGGLLARRYLRDALRDKIFEIRGFISDLRQEIADKWGSR